MCFSELVLAGLGKAVAVYSTSSMCLVCTRVTQAVGFVLEHGGLSCPFCWDAQLQLTESWEEQLLPVIFAPEKAA